MYASQTRTNTKYTDFIRSYYPDPSKNVNVTETQTFSNNFVLSTANDHNTNLSSRSLNNSNSNLAATEHSTFHNNVHDTNSSSNLISTNHQNLNPNSIGNDESSLNSLNNLHNDDSLPKTKFAELFSVDESHALRLKLLKDTSEIHGGIVKVFSDSDLVRLHNKIQESFNFPSSPVSHLKHPNSANSSKSKSKLKRSQSEDSTSSYTGSNRALSASSNKTHKTVEVKVDIEHENEIINANAEENNLKKSETDTDKGKPEDLLGRGTGIGTGSTTGAGIARLENDLHKLHEETLQILSGKREDDNHLPPYHGHGPTFFNHVSYQEILKAEHIALRRELLNNIREISRATFFEDLYTGKTRTGDNKNSNNRDGNGDEIGDLNNTNRTTSHRQKRVDSNRHHANDLEIESALKNFSFHGNSTADPTDRIDQWIRNSQEHLNHLPLETRHNEHENVKNRPTETGSDNNLHNQTESQTPSLHASLFHDSIWNEDEDGTFNNFDNEDELDTIVAAPAKKINSKKLPLPVLAANNKEKQADPISLHENADSNVKPASSSDRKKPLVIHNNIVINNFDPEDKSHDPHRSRNWKQQHADSQTDELVTENDVVNNKSSKSVDYVNFEDNEHEFTEVNHLELGEAFPSPSVHEFPSNSVKTNEEAKFGFGSNSHRPGPGLGPGASTEFSEVDFENSDVIPFKHSRISQIASASATSAPRLNHFSHSLSTSLRRSLSTASYHNDDTYDSLNYSRLHRDRVPPALLPVIPQPAIERFPARIYQPRYKYERIKFQRENQLTSSLPSLKSGIQLAIDSSIGPPLAFNDSRNIIHAIIKTNKSKTKNSILNRRMNDTRISQSTTNSTTTTTANDPIIHNSILGMTNIHNHFSKLTDPPRNPSTSPSPNHNHNPNPNSIKQLHHDDHVRIIQAELLQLHPPSYIKNPKKGTRVPGVIRRHNMDQWVAKKVWFYVNGDEHIPKFEYRFKPKRDVKSMDGLCDVLSNRLKLVNGVRYIFTIDGELVHRLEDLRHEHYYVASSTKKFKVIDRMNFESILKPDFQKSFKTKKVVGSFPSAF